MARSNSSSTLRRARHVLLYACSALAGCSVVLEGKGELRDAATSLSNDAGTPWVVMPGLSDAGQEGATGTSAGGPGGGALGGAAGGTLGGSGGSPVDAGGAPEDSGGAGSADAQVGASLCPLDGMFALDFKLHVRWAGTQFADLVPVIDPGDGEVSFILLSKFSHTPQGAKVLGQICDTSVPEFDSSFVEESYATYFPPDMWDSPTMPRFSFALTGSCSEPGPDCKLQSGQIYAPLGVDLPDPATQWPTSAAGVVWPDHDGDGELGVTAYMLGSDRTSVGGRPYSHPPVNALLLRRVNKVMLGLRIKLLLNGTWPSCDLLQGSIPESHVDSRALGCNADSDPSECTPSELSFLDSNLPTWAVRDGLFKGVRMEPGADCSAARARLR